MQLHRIHVFGIVTHHQLGVMITHDQISEGSWDFWGCEVLPGEDWRSKLFLKIKQKTWIQDLHYSRILWAQSFLPKVITDEATFVLFVQVDTQEAGHCRGYRWVKNIQELESLALFHPLVKTLCEDVLNGKNALVAE